MKRAIITIIASLAASTAFAAGSGDHSHGHGEGGQMEMTAIGMPGSADKVDRTIGVIMRETDDGNMVFEPNAFEIAQGETIRFNVTNEGELEHEFVIDTIEGNATHKELMAKMDMRHDDPNSVRLDPGKSGEVIWTFANEGGFEFACLISGHYESGMHGPIEVVATEAERTFTEDVETKVETDSRAK